jgi:hypothetical protein
MTAIRSPAERPDVISTARASDLPIVRRFEEQFGPIRQVRFKFWRAVPLP